MEVSTTAAGDTNGGAEVNGAVDNEGVLFPQSADPEPVQPQDLPEALLLGLEKLLFLSKFFQLSHGEGEGEGEGEEGEEGEEGRREEGEVSILFFKSASIF